jgi:DNA-binding MarR family transcriptional regulator
MYLDRSIVHGAVADKVGLSVTDLKALDLLQRLGPLAAGAIASRTGLATASVTSLVDRLHRKRLVRRVRDRRDRRRVVVSLTPYVQETIAPYFASLNRRMLARFGAYSDAQIATRRRSSPLPRLAERRRLARAPRRVQRGVSFVTAASAASRCRSRRPS